MHGGVRRRRFDTRLLCIYNVATNFALWHSIYIDDTGAENACNRKEMGQ
jgi:hypothetical protein